MPHKKREFENNEVYHVTLRRVAEKPLFLDIDDDFRGIYSIYEFNNADKVSISKRRRDRSRFKQKTVKLGQGLPLAQTEPVKLARVVSLSGGGIMEVKEPDKRIKFVEVLAFCLMPNHLHLLLRQLVIGGISKYMQKLGSGLAAHFFEKYFPDTKKRGHFFQDRFHATPILTDEQLQTAFVYIHTNPLSIVEPNWKEKGIKNIKKAIDFLENKYRWSSYFDYLGKKNFSSIIEKEKDFLTEAMGGVKNMRQAVNDWIKYKKIIATK